MLAAAAAAAADSSAGASMGRDAGARQLQGQQGGRALAGGYQALPGCAAEEPVPAVGRHQHLLAMTGMTESTACDWCQEGCQWIAAAAGTSSSMQATRGGDLSGAGGAAVGVMESEPSCEDRGWQSCLLYG